MPKKLYLFCSLFVLESTFAGQEQQNPHSFDGLSFSFGVSYGHENNKFTYDAELGLMDIYAMYNDGWRDDAIHSSFDGYNTMTAEGARVYAEYRSKLYNIEYEAPKLPAVNNDGKLRGTGGYTFGPETHILPIRGTKSDKKFLLRTHNTAESAAGLVGVTYRIPLGNDNLFGVNFDLLIRDKKKRVSGFGSQKYVIPADVNVVTILARTDVDSEVPATAAVKENIIRNHFRGLDRGDLDNVPRYEMRGGDYPLELDTNDIFYIYHSPVSLAEGGWSADWENYKTEVGKILETEVTDDSRIDIEAGLNDKVDTIWVNYRTGKSAIERVVTHGRLQPSIDLTVGHKFFENSFLVEGFFGYTWLDIKHRFYNKYLKGYHYKNDLVIKRFRPSVGANFAYSVSKNAAVGCKFRYIFNAKKNRIKLCNHYHVACYLQFNTDILFSKWVD